MVVDQRVTENNQGRQSSVAIMYDRCRGDYCWSASNAALCRSGTCVPEQRSMRNKQVKDAEERFLKLWRSVVCIDKWLRRRKSQAEKEGVLKYAAWSTRKRISRFNYLLGAMNLSSSSSLRPALLRDSDDEAFFRCPCAMMYVVWRSKAFLPEKRLGRSRAWPVILFKINIKHKAKDKYRR